MLQHAVRRAGEDDMSSVTHRWLKALQTYPKPTTDTGKGIISRCVSGCSAFEHLLVIYHDKNDHLSTPNLLDALSYAKRAPHM